MRIGDRVSVNMGRDTINGTLVDILEANKLQSPVKIRIYYGDKYPASALQRNKRRLIIKTESGDYLPLPVSGETDVSALCNTYMEVTKINT